MVPRSLQRKVTYWKHDNRADYFEVWKAAIESVEKFLANGVPRR